MKDVFIIGGLRSPIGKTNGQLKDFLPEKLAANILNQTINKYNLTANKIDEVILGNAVGLGGLARLSLLEAGWPVRIPGTTIDFQCGSGLSAINLGANLIRSGQAELIVAGGVESTSLEPRRQLNPNDPRFTREDNYLDRAIFSSSSLGDPDMGQAAEKVAQLKDISRQAMDQWALRSHQKATKTKQKGLLDEIIAPIKKDNQKIDSDESIRPNISLKLLERMPPAFVTEGRVTAGNACLTHDGAAVIILASKEAVKEYNLTPEAKFIQGATVGVNPNLSPLGPIPAIKKLLQEKNISITKIDALEINEAFAVKILACLQELNITKNKVNILGGALAYGHPYGASGAIILLHLLQALKEVQGELGITSLGVAGGQGIATLIRRAT
ncbi:acetyl-CoA acetyltransferase [Halobacteroides halobius DSM 5150]|uniref:acetyl-CoA C-acetyltransferase n=1 Tax=Halobacteroides halobius (strain ATCC 35273 / DSM 5150 / MD-1) TaxID=748449 RepID=L0K4Q5_HALHC|nr:thiolase family protein [Halobacteroides halobius]AGB40252.1 acetyl-CoA acetyltransferase [Halobacteroides halobius DSM 5150]